MSHALALWPGEPPTDVGSACREYSHRLITHGIAWHRERKIPPRNPRVMAFFRDAAVLTMPFPDEPTIPWGDEETLGMIWGDVLTLELNGPQPRALATLARLADHHGLVLFDLYAHRLLTLEDISTTFGEPMIPVPAKLPWRERLMRCSELFTCSEELGVILPDPLDCSRPMDPVALVVIEDELSRFRRVLDDFDLDDLEQLRWRLDELISAVGDDALG